MSGGRLPTGLVVTALLRMANDGGGMGVVRARGDAQAGAILVLADTHQGLCAIERGITAQGLAGIVTVPVADDGEDYWRRRRARDPDLWVVELNVPDAQRLVAEMIGGD